MDTEKQDGQVSELATGLYAVKGQHVAWYIDGYGVTENEKFVEKYCQRTGREARPLQYAIPAQPVRFGAGSWVVVTGTYDESPALFIEPSKTPGKVGESAEREGIPRDRLIPGAMVMTFPTAEQARAVADAICCPAPSEQRVARCVVPVGQTPLDEKLNHRFLDVIKEGETARDAGTGSPYHGHSLEHCLHSVGWVSRDLRLALDETRSRAAPAPAEVEGLVRAHLSKVDGTARGAFHRETAERLTALQAENERLRGERQALAEAICGGEDFPGLLAATTVEALAGIARKTHRDHSESVDARIKAQAVADHLARDLRMANRVLRGDGRSTYDGALAAHAKLKGDV